MHASCLSMPQLNFGKVQHATIFGETNKIGMTHSCVNEQTTS